MKNLRKRYVLPSHAAPGAMWILCALLVAAAAMIPSCKESLPPYGEPQDFLKGFAEATYTYPLDNMLTVAISIENTFDETLQREAAFSGSVRITPHADPGFSKTIALSPSNITVVGTYNPSTRMLTFDPGEIIRMQIKWNFLDDLNRDIRDTLFTYVDDPTCVNGRKIAHPQTFTIEASVLVFKGVGHVQCPPIELTLCHVDRVVGVRDCPPLDPVTACNLIK